MAYRIDFDGLDGLYNQLRAQTSEWHQGLESLSNAVQTLADSNNMYGSGADSIRAYLENIHQSIISAISELIVLHSANCLLYKQDYQQNVDKAIHAVILSNELSDLHDDFEAQKRLAISIDEQLHYSLRNIQDIFYVQCGDIYDIDAAHTALLQHLTDLDGKIRATENSHCESDFKETEAMIQSLRTLISEYQNHSRTYMSEFSPAQLSSSATFLALYQAHLGVSTQITGRTEAIHAALENENARVAILQQEEYEERQRKATTQKWIVTGACIIGSIALIAVTGGAATPLVVGAISATSGAIIAGTTNLADQYVEHGNVLENSETYDFADFGKDVVVGGIAGFVTGYVGAGVSQAVTSGLSGTATGSALLNSSNAAVRIGTGATIGATSQVTSGVASRGAATLITSGGDVDAAINEAFNLKSIVFDATMGGVIGGVHASKNPPVGKKLSSDDLSKEVLSTKPKNSPNPNNWMENGGKIYVDGNGTWTYEAADGTHVCYNDGYPNFKRAGLVEKGVDIGAFSTEGNSRYADFHKADSISQKSPDTTWHHSEDGHTLQAVDTYYHKLFTHRGGFSISKGG